MPQPIPAKINLFLSVLERQKDGYHKIASVLQKIGLADEIEIIESEDGKIELGCDLPPTLNSQENLVFKAAKLLRAEAKNLSLGAKILLKKRIPSGAGLGGGSADAAATLEILNSQWQLNFSLEKLRALALKLGSDVPFFLGPPAAVCEGVGEILQPLKPRELFLTIVKPKESLATALVYQQFDLKPRPALNLSNFLEIYKKGSLEELGNALANSLAAPAEELEPAVKKVTTLLRAMTPYVLMSGSGTAVFGLFKNLALASEAAQAISEKDSSLFVLATKTLTV